MRPFCSNSPVKPGTAEAGFTLMEVVIAVTVAAILLTTVYGVFSSMSATRQRLEEDGETYHRAQVIFQRLGRELRSYYSQERLAVFAGGEDERQRPYVLFSTTARTPFGGSRGGIAKVRYWVDRDPRDDTALALFRNEWNAFEAEPEEGEQRVVGDIREFRLRFFGFGGWEEDWDAGIEAAPRAVQVSLVLRSGERDVPFETVWDLPYQTVSQKVTP